jgi:hypothetical protein
MQLQPMSPLFFGVAASQRIAEDVSLQILQGTDRILCVKKALQNVSPGRVHSWCCDGAIEDVTSNFSQGCLSLEEQDLVAFRASVCRITDARPVRSPPFGFFRPPTPSPVEICTCTHSVTCLQIRIACEHMQASMRIGPYAPVCACAHFLRKQL